MPEKNKKVLYVIDNCEYGGGEAGFADLAGILARTGWNVAVCAGPGGKFQERIESCGIKFLPADFSGRASIKTLFNLQRVMLEEAPDLVHSQGRRADFYAAFAARLAGIRSIVTTIQMPVKGYNLNPLRKFAYRIAEKSFEGFFRKTIVVSERLKKLVTEGHSLPGEKVTLVYNGIDTAVYDYALYDKRAARARLGLPEQCVLAGSISRLVWQKGLEYFLKAVPAIREKFPDARFVVAGEGPLAGNLHKIAGETGVGEICFFPGFVEDTPLLLSALDVLVLPSVAEGFPLITLEAMAMRRPVVASDIEGIREQIINGETGLLVEPRSPEKLAEAVTKALEPCAAEKMGAAARARVEKLFSIEPMAMETEKIYREVLENS